MKFLLPVIAFVIALTVVSCKTTEANYRQAYEVAAEQRREATGLDSTIYGRVRKSAVNTWLVVNGDSLPVRREYIGYTEGGGSSRENVKRYNVVVGQFRQVFNAKQMRERLISGGYDSAMMVHTREPLYYVVTATASTPEEILQEWRKVMGDKNLVLKSPMPFILSPSHFR